eukprot:TRINITY_DN15939_c0_g1_i1.p1 TRINITY_DN15939_c0_g1~~TRINITY_DN15939_c0_g1_i1.p1  ORF type:complete len:321 (-),score=51.95 TRINITY_DN15939_c0_g1_i1:563-1525(-)
MDQLEADQVRGWLVRLAKQSEADQLVRGATHHSQRCMLLLLTHWQTIVSAWRRQHHEMHLVVGEWSNSHLILAWRAWHGFIQERQLHLTARSLARSTMAIAMHTHSIEVIQGGCNGATVRRETSIQDSATEIQRAVRARRRFKDATVTVLQRVHRGNIARMLAGALRESRGLLPVMPEDVLRVIVVHLYQHSLLDCRAVSRTLRNKIRACPHTLKLKSAQALPQIPELFPSLCGLEVVSGDLRRAGSLVPPMAWASSQCNLTPISGLSNLTALSVQGSSISSRELKLIMEGVHQPLAIVDLANCSNICEPAALDHGFLQL